MNLLDRYVIRALLGGAALVLTVLIALGALFLFANQQDDIGVGTYSAIDALWFVLLNLPQQLYEFMPIGVMIGALLGLGALARGSELTVMRAAGISVTQSRPVFRFSQNSICSLEMFILSSGPCSSLPSLASETCELLEVLEDAFCRLLSACCTCK